MQAWTLAGLTQRSARSDPQDSVLPDMARVRLHASTTSKTSRSISPQRFCRLHRYFRILANPCSLSAPFTPKPSAAISNPSRPSRAAFSSAHGARSRLHRQGPPPLHFNSGAATHHTLLGRQRYYAFQSPPHAVLARWQLPAQTPMLYAENFCPNRPEGACPECHGLGRILAVSERTMVPDSSLNHPPAHHEVWPTPSTLRAQRSRCWAISARPACNGLSGGEAQLIKLATNYTPLLRPSIDIGPGGGDEGGRIVARGTPQRIAESSVSRTAPT